MNESISVKERLPNEEDDVLILVREIEHYGGITKKGKCIIGNSWAGV